MSSIHLGASVTIKLTGIRTASLFYTLHINMRIWSNMCVYFIVLFMHVCSIFAPCSKWLRHFHRSGSCSLESSWWPSLEDLQMYLGAGARGVRGTLRNWQPGRACKGHLCFAPIQRLYHSEFSSNIKSHLLFHVLTHTMDPSWLRGTFSGSSSNALAKLVLCLRRLFGVSFGASNVIEVS